MDELFSAGSPKTDSPLADRMRPRTLDEVIGQDHIVGPGRLLRRAIQADRLSSVIFYGPPGTGKTSLARVIANTTRGAFESLNAVLTGVKDIREVIDRAEERRRLYGKRTILFVDEVHRWNKAQQDALLPWVENGAVILVGATTENPFFEVNRALVSRSRVFQLKALDADDLRTAALRTLADRERGYGKWKVVFTDGALEHLLEVAGGDVRSLLNALELAIETSAWTFPGGESPPQPGEDETRWPPPENAEIIITLEAAEESIQKKALLYDRDGDYHFDTISAFIKSVRGSDPDAALYWLAKMVRAGEDPSFIFRRMIILASEDVGLADPRALEVVIACAQAFDRTGLPEGRFPLAHACLYLATAPKSNTAMAFFDALKEVDREDPEVPNHLRDPNRDAESFGHGEGYIYPHAYREHWAAQRYLPGALQGKIFYTPSTVGYEGRIREEVLRKREIQAAMVLGDPPADAAGGEPLSWSPPSRGRENWLHRLESGRSSLLLADREAIFGQCSPARHHRILVAAANDGLLLWESLRRVPEGLTAALVDSEAAGEALLRYAAALDETERPRTAVSRGGPFWLPAPEEAERIFSCAAFDHIIAREPWRRVASSSPDPAEAFSGFARAAALLLAPGGNVVLLQSPPGLGERLSRILREERGGPEALADRLAAAEEVFFGSPPKNPSPGKPAVPLQPWTWTAETLETAFREAGLTLEITVLNREEERPIGSGDLDLWFNPDRSPWGGAMAAALGKQDLAAVREGLEERIRRGPVLWKWKSLLIKGKREKK
ncbi:MAG: AAA family ATPase [Treponema sp.]|jgi:putative ATPase|nr:AAA family ATPase [Treponema sp.]